MNVNVFLKLNEDQKTKLREHLQTEISKRIGFTLDAARARLRKAGADGSVGGRAAAKDAQADLRRFGGAYELVLDDLRRNPEKLGLLLEAIGVGSDVGGVGGDVGVDEGGGGVGRLELDVGPLLDELRGMDNLRVAVDGLLGGDEFEAALVDAMGPLARVVERLEGLGAEIAGVIQEWFDQSLGAEGGVLDRLVGAERRLAEAEIDGRGVGLLVGLLPGVEQAAGERAEAARRVEEEARRAAAVAEERRARAAARRRQVAGEREAARVAAELEEQRNLTALEDGISVAQREFDRIQEMLAAQRAEEVAGMTMDRALAELESRLGAMGHQNAARAAHMESLTADVVPVEPELDFDDLMEEARRWSGHPGRVV